ncbi:MAG: hypothetical protein EZS28_047811 [Streblomastix strix]|uniref:Uncharacterized protein n=1 Tax=Streblomastix strix TaxID=222440 RepID=A0A5J4TFM2_9EUKA|nr:MAG: hypothetical protein EZS28_047811 [Streblomastix strix]
MNYQASPQILWQPKRLTLSPNLFIQLTGALDLYDGLAENAANPIVNNASSMKFIDLETWYYKTQYDSQSSLADVPIQCPFIGNFQQYPQMLIISVSNQLQSITLQGIGGQGFSYVCYKQNLIGAPVLWGQNMLSQEFPQTSPMISKFKTYGSGASSKVNLMIASQRQCIQGVIQAYIGVGYALVAINEIRLF